MLRRFHDVEPLAGLEMMSQSELSVLVVSKSLRTVPYPLLGENTMVLSDSMILAPDEQGRLALMFRCAAACSHPPVQSRSPTRGVQLRLHPPPELRRCPVDLLLSQT